MTGFKKKIKGRRSRSWGRFCFRGGAFVLIFFLSSILYLRFLGVPSFILEPILRRLAESGLCVEVEELKLTYDGWVASDVRYYSNDPDDFEPILCADTVYVRKSHFSNDRKLKGYRVEGEGVSISPPVGLCVGIPTESRFREVGRVDLTLGFANQEVLIRNLAFSWMDVAFEVKGRILGLGQSLPAAEDLDWLPIRISQNQYQKIERWVDSIRLNSSAVSHVEFLVNYANPAGDHIKFDFGASDISIQDVDFERAEIAGGYDHNCFHLDQAKLSRGKDALALHGRVDFAENQLDATLKNGIGGTVLFPFVPASVRELFEQGLFSLEEFPTFELLFGPTSLSESWFDHLDLTFDLKKSGIMNLKLPSFSGRAVWNGSQLDLTELQAHVLGQENLAETMGSSMLGGGISGEAFWNVETHCFGVDVETGIDPNLLLPVLSFSDISCNVIRDFKFKRQPPQVKLLMEGNCSAWHDTFQMGLQIGAFDLVYKEVPLSSLDCSVRYQGDIVDIESVLARQEIKYLRGSASIDYGRSVVSFDGVSTLAPDLVEDLTFPELDLFGQHVSVEGESSLKAHGRIDWEAMRTTDFDAEIHLSDVKTPAMWFDQLDATVDGNGPVVTVKDAEFSVHGGTGTGSFAVLTGMPGEGLPCKLDVVLNGVDVKSWLEYINIPLGESGAGLLYGWLKADADLARPFFETATGEGRLNVKKGRLADLPLFNGLSKAIRYVFPSFSVFSVSEVSADFILKNGDIHSDNAYFDGDFMSAKGHGDYFQETGFDAFLQIQLFNDKTYFKIFRFLTDPVLGLLELRLNGSFSDPSWKLNTFLNDDD